MIAPPVMALSAVQAVSVVGMMVLAVVLAFATLRPAAGRVVDPAAILHFSAVRVGGLNCVCVLVRTGPRTACAYLADVFDFDEPGVVPVMQDAILAARYGAVVPTVADVADLDIVIPPGYTYRPAP